MSTMLDSEGPGLTVPPADPRSLWRRWVDFWFPAADPTTLAFIRVTTGLLVLYTHLAYSVDLQSFFGEHGWYSAAAIKRERHEYPWMVTPFTDWDQQEVIPAKVPDFPHRRKAVIGFIRDLPADKGQRAQALRYLNRATAMENPAYTRSAIGWVSVMGSVVEEREKHLTVLQGGKLATEQDTKVYSEAVPPMFRVLPEAEKAAIADEVRAFWAVLPKDRGDQPDRQYLFNHLTELSPAQLRAFVQFLNDLPADHAERAKLIDYLEYWNNDPRKAMWTGHAIFSVWFHVTDPTQMALIHAGVLVLIVLFTLGLFTRVTSVLVWLAVVGYIHRSQQVLFGMDTMMNILLLYLMIGNSGAALSLDRLIARYRAARASLRRCGAIDDATRRFLAAPPPSRSAGFALRLIQVHFCFIYLAAGLSKLKGANWWNGQAFWDVVVNPEFTLMQYTWYERLLRGLADFKPLFHFVTATGVWFTLFVEIGMPFLVWTRLRWLMMLLATAMHAIIGVLMGLNLFELLMMVMILAFMPDRVIRDRLAGGLGLKRLAFLFNPSSASSARAAALVVAADTDAQVTLTPEPGLASPVVVDPEGKRQSGADGVGALFRHVRLLSMVRLVSLVPGVKGLWARWFCPTPAQPAPPTAPRPGAPTAAS